MRTRLAVSLAMAVSATVLPIVGAISAAPVPSRTPLCLSIPDAAPGDVAVLNITNTDATGGGFGALRSSDASPVPSRPASQRYSSVNFAPGAPNPNLALTTVGSDRQVCYDSDGATTDLILDLAATFPSGALDSGDPERLVDTRDTSPVRPRTPLCISVPRGQPGDAAFFNITNTDATSGGFGALRSSDATPVPNRPAEQQFSSVNFAPGSPNPNLAITTIGPDRQICYDSDGGTAHVILDLVATASGDTVTGGDGVRLVDTRTGSPVRPRTPLCVDLAIGVGDAAIINITNTGATSQGYGALRPSDATPIPSRQADDQYSSVNFSSGPANPNLAITTVGADGRFCYDSDGGTADVILDLVAVVSRDDIDSGDPERLVDTREAAPEPETPPTGIPVPDVPPVAPAGSFAFIVEARDGTPARWNPCDPITFKTNMSGATPRQASAFLDAIEDAERATGIDFVDIGTFQGGSDDRFPLAEADAFFGVFPANSAALEGAAGRAGTFIDRGREIVAATGVIASDISDRGAEAVWLHEIGHVLGLDHVNDENQVMFPFTGLPFVEYSVGDLNGLYELSAAQGCVSGSQRKQSGIEDVAVEYRY